MGKRLTALLLALMTTIGFARLTPGAAADDGVDEYIRLTDGVSAEMMEAEYWLGRKNKQAVHVNDVLMSAEEIAAFNRQNAAMITVGSERYSLGEIPDSVSGDVVRALIGSAAAPENPDSRYLCGRPTDKAYWDALTENLALDAVADSVPVRFGYSVERASLRIFPSSDFIGGTPGDRLYDKLVMSEFMPYLPLAVLHESADGAWYYVLMYGFGGWVEKDRVALCTDRADWLDRMEPERFLTVTGRVLHLPEEPYSPGVSALELPMGTRLPLVRAQDAPETVNRRKSYGCYVVRLPVRGDNGMIDDEYALVSAAEDVCIGSLPYTRANELRQAFKLLGDRYGWAGMYGANDCSGIVHEIFACFGFVLPRTAEDMMTVQGTERLDLSSWTDEQKLKALSNIPAGALLGFPGHIMIYLGMHGGKAYVISAVGSFAAADAAQGADYAVNSVTVNSLADTRRKSGSTWIASLDTALIYAGKS